jgi:hypothetical protein
MAWRRRKDNDSRTLAGWCGNWHGLCNACGEQRHRQREKAMHRSEFDRDPYGRRTDGFERVGGRVLEFLRSRGADHWIMFLAGVVIGMIFG